MGSFYLPFFLEKKKNPRVPSRQKVGREWKRKEVLEEQGLAQDPAAEWDPAAA